VRNLIDNALVHGGDSPRVWVSVAPAAQAVLLRVDDTGPGIAATERGRVFDRFHRAEGGSEGSGLGLAIVRAIAAQHGGAVALTDSPLGGLRVEVRLPLR
jgi:signal transduction histidine kinase